MNQARNQTVLVTGAAGFVGSHLTDRLLELGNTVIGIDNFSRGTQGNLSRSLLDAGFRFFETDLSNLDSLRQILSSFEIDTVWHMVANSDIGAGVADPKVDLKDTFLSTFNLLVAMRDARIRKIAFASTSAVYGVHDQTLEENTGPLFPISNYGAMKLACEAIISAAVGKLSGAGLDLPFSERNRPARHARHHFRFLTKLARNPMRSRSAGRWHAAETVSACIGTVDAMLLICEHASEPLNWFNIGPPEEGTTVKEIARGGRQQAAPHTPIHYTGGNKGWVGDVPKFRYSIEKLKWLGWSPELTSGQAVERAVKEIHEEFQHAASCSS